MNPETNKLELLPDRLLKDLEVRREMPNMAGQIQALQNSLTAIQQAEPDKGKWTTFSIGELVDLQREHDGIPRACHQVSVKNIHADGLLLKGADLSISFHVGQIVRVKEEKCRVKHISSKGIYVAGAA